MKTSKITLILLFHLSFTNAFGQNILRLSLNGSTPTVTYKDENDNNIKPGDINPGDALKISADLAKFENIEIKGLDDKITENDLIISLTEGAQPVSKYTFTLEFDIKGGKKDNTMAIEIGKDDIQFDDNQTARDFLINNKELKSKFKDHKKYSYYKNAAYIFLDEDGRPIDNIPVNIDENDLIEFYIICKSKDVNKFSVIAPDAEYNPSDLQIRPSGGTGAQSASSAPKPSYKIAIFKLGPYTSETVSFQILYGKDLINTITLRVNKIYHGAVGISPIRTGLGNPSYEIIDLDPSSKTIVKTNEGSQGMLIANYIYYFQGRDVIKEPTAGQRLGGMIGTSLTNKFTENFFAGLVYEFARGGSIVGGVHYGKYKVLADKKFKLGESSFSGTEQSDIKLSSSWDFKLFAGISLDLRAFRALLGVNNQ